MRILWFSWKDEKNPQAGGAEAVSGELRRRLVSAGHEVVLLTRAFAGGEKEEILEGVKIIRLGNEYTVYFEAYRFYRKNLKGWADLIVEEINTVPFFTPLYAKEKKQLFFHQLCREIWFYQLGKIMGLCGWLLEPLYLFFLSSQETITVSESSRADLKRFGFKKIKIISEGIELKPLTSLSAVKKFSRPTVLGLGAIRPMKRTDHIVEAFEIAKEKIPDLRLILAGSATGAYGRQTLRYLQKSSHRQSIKFLGRVSRERKIELMQKSHLIAVTSVKEGWGLIVTEANSQGTPAVAYNVDGLRDSIRAGETGWLCEKNSPQNLALKIVEAFSDSTEYARRRNSAFEWSRKITFKQSFEDFSQELKINSKESLDQLK